MRITLLLTALIPALPVHADSFEWTAYGGDGRGQRYAPVAAITPANVGQLELAWDFRTGELGQGFDRANDALTFEATPLFTDGVLYVSTATGVVFAVDAAERLDRPGMTRGYIGKGLRTGRERFQRHESAFKLCNQIDGGVEL